jgi:protein gp37
MKNCIKANWHRYQILTKRAERLAEISDNCPGRPTSGRA